MLLRPIRQGLVEHLPHDIRGGIRSAVSGLLIPERATGRGRQREQPSRGATLKDRAQRHLQAQLVLQPAHERDGQQ